MIDKNRLEITGNLVAAPELRYTPKGNPVVRARLIHTDSHKDRETGEWVKGKPMGIDFEIWGTYAEAFANKARKGTALLLEGALKPNDFEKEDGTKVFSVRLRVNEWQIVAQPRVKDDAGESLPEEAAASKGRNRRKTTAANG